MSQVRFLPFRLFGGGIGRRRMLKLTAIQRTKHMDYKFAEREAVSCTVSRKGIACKVQILARTICARNKKRACSITYSAGMRRMFMIL